MRIATLIFILTSLALVACDGCLATVPEESVIIPMDTPVGPEVPAIEAAPTEVKPDMPADAAAEVKPST